MASEVRALAQRSAQAAREIKQLVQESIERAEGGSKVVANAQHSISSIVESTQQVGQAAQELDGTTQQNAALVEQTAASAGALRHCAVQLSDRVARF